MVGEQMAISATVSVQQRNARHEVVADMLHAQYGLLMYCACIIDGICKEQGAMKCNDSATAL